MSLNIGVPQAIVLALYFMSLVINCVQDGEYGVPNYCHNCGHRVIDDD